MENWSANGSADGRTGDGVVADLSGRLAVEVVPDDRSVALMLEGELDLETAPEFDTRLAGLAIAGVERVLIDLRGVTFMDSTGLRSIIAAHRVAESNGHRLVVRRGSRQVRRLFELTGLNDRLSFEDD